jgi:hypothetical protein
MPTPTPPPPDPGDDELDPPMEPAQVKDMFPDDYLDPDEDA